jgi:hypothetical protein
MEATLKFNLPEEQELFDLAIKAGPMQSALWEISQQVFRPARKHGYPDGKINELINKLGPDAEELIGELEQLFYKILEEQNVSTI